MLSNNIYNLKFKLREITKGFRLNCLKTFFKYLDTHNYINAPLNGGLVIKVFKGGGRHILCDVYIKVEPPTI